MTTASRRQHTLEVLVENSPGVLARVAGLFSRRAFNIDSLNVGPTENPTTSLNWNAFSEFQPRTHS